MEKTLVLTVFTISMLQCCLCEASVETRVENGFYEAKASTSSHWYRFAIFRHKSTKDDGKPKGMQLDKFIGQEDACIALIEQCVEKLLLQRYIYRV